MDISSVILNVYRLFDFNAFYTGSCPIRGQFYNEGGCHPIGATCEFPDPPELCDAFTCVCPRGQVISHDGSRCIDVADCRKLNL